MAIQKRFPVSNPNLTPEEVKAELEKQFPKYKCYFRKGLKIGKFGVKDGRYVQVDKSLFCGVAVILNMDNHMTVYGQFGNIIVQSMIGGILTLTLNSKLVDEVGAAMQKTFG